jgi:acetyl/propionyl-CoA carboxylase alpha subunit
VNLSTNKLSIHLLTVFSRDASSRHVREADEAINIGSIDSSARNPFLDIELLVQTAISTSAQAIHPGYGYLSENAEFAQQVRDAGLIFIGPSPSAMSTLGDKRSSKDYLRQNAPEVPLIPGFSGSSQDAEALSKVAVEIGFPVMLKASAGGGGKGMRIVREAAQLKDELERAQSEARRSFGSDDCILEKFIESSKHVEIQIMGDSHGNVVSFLDRDCSVQRRHQKVIEETPCAFLTEETRKKMSETAVRVAELIGYENAGTVEFVVDIKTHKFYFLEVNARLQVEHPITEEVTGVDLVSLQIFVAAGGSLKSLPSLQNVTQYGHAIECRLCAENPEKDFFPEHGKVHLWLPASGALAQGRDIRYETAIQTGSSVSIYFDSMIAKLVVWAPTRALAIEKMTKVLAQTACVGVKTNQLFMQSCLSNPAFHDATYTTAFIPSHLDELLQPPSVQGLPELEKIASILPSLVIRRLPDYATALSRSKPLRNIRMQFRNQKFDPVNIHCDVVTTVSWPNKAIQEADTTSEQRMMCVWKRATAGSLSGTEEEYLFPVPDKQTLKDEEVSAAAEISAQYNEISQALRTGKATSSTAYQVRIISWLPAEGNPALPNSWLASTIEVSVNGSKLTAHVAIPSTRAHTLEGQVDCGQHVYCHLPAIGTNVMFKRDTLLSFVESNRSAAKANKGAEQKTIAAPMPCKVLSVLKNNGDEVQSGDSVMVIESMKMEVNILVAASGKFQTDWKVGDAVEEGKILCSIV